MSDIIYMIGTIIRSARAVQSELDINRGEQCAYSWRKDDFASVCVDVSSDGVSNELASGFGCDLLDRDTSLFFSNRPIQVSLVTFIDDLWNAHDDKLTQRCLHMLWRLSLSCHM